MVEVVTLTPEELAEIKENAEGRNVIKERRGIQTNKISDNLSDLLLHELEVKGQYAVSKYLGVPMDWSVCAGGNKKPHFEVDGITMRVQTPTHHPPILKLNRLQDFDTDLMVVCMVREPAKIAIYGCVSRERFSREHMLKDFGKGKRLVLLSWYLMPIEDYRAEAGLAVKKAAASEIDPPKKKEPQVG